MSFSVLKLTNKINNESTIESFVDDKLSIDIYHEALEFVSNEKSILTNEQINIYRSILSEEVVDEQFIIVSKTKASLSRLVDWIKDKAKHVNAKFVKQDKTIKESHTLLNESLDNGLIINDFTNTNPITITKDTYVRDIREEYLDSFRIHNETSRISSFEDFNHKLNSVIKAIDKVSFNESGSIYGFEPFSSFDQCNLLEESVAIYIACLCEAIERNYKSIEENSFYNSDLSEAITEGLFFKGNYNYKFYNKNSSDNIVDRLKRNRTLLSTVDKFTDTNAELKYINHSLPKLKKTLAEMKIDYEDFCSLPKEEQINQSRFIDVSEKSLYTISNITGMVTGIRFINDKPDKFDIDRIKSNAKYNMYEVQRCITYMEKRKRQIEKEKMKGGKNNE